jgi:hypothetical protein
MAEVFTPSWICNAQNNLVDNSWFGKEGVFNKEIVLKNKTKSWETTKDKIIFPVGKTWLDYVQDTRLEISCGEAPYLVSRYDTTTGKFIKITDRIGILDRKLRVVNENLESKSEWLQAVEIAYKSTYGFEWQGDSLLLAREALLVTFIENFNQKFDAEPSIEEIQNIAEIISWNIWQMDGLKYVRPLSCRQTIAKTNEAPKDQLALFAVEKPKKQKVDCEGCRLGSPAAHTGIYAKIMDWKTESIA